MPTSSSPYDLDRAETARRAARWLRLHRDPPGRFVAVSAGSDGTLADVARTVERVVSEAHRERDDDSRFVLVLDRERSRPAGAMRIVDDGGRWELATVSVLPEYRKKRSALQVSALLYRAFVLLGTVSGVRRVTVTADRATTRNLLAIGAPLTPVGTDAVLHGDLAEFPQAFAEQAARLRRSARPGGLEVRGADLRRYARRRIAADLAARLATGDDLDPQIVLPARTG